MHNPWDPVVVKAVIDAPPEAVFDVLSDPHTYPRWLVGAQRIRRVDPEFPREGATFEHNVGPAEATTVHDFSEAVHVEPPYRLVLEVHLGPMRGTVDLRCTPRGGRTEVCFGERPEGGTRILAPFLAPLLAARNRESLRRLGRYVEQHAA